MPNIDDNNIDPNYKTLLEDNKKLKDRVDDLDKRLNKVLKFNEELLDRDTSIETKQKQDEEDRFKKELEKKKDAFFNGK